MEHEYVANDSRFSDSSEKNFALGDLNPGLYIIDRTDVEVEFPDRSRMHNTSKDTGLCGRLILVILMLLRARHTIPPWLTKLSDVAALRETSRACSTIEPLGGMIGAREVSDDSSCLVSVSANTSSLWSEKTATILLRTDRMFKQPSFTLSLRGCQSSVTGTLMRLFWLTPHCEGHCWSTNGDIIDLGTDTTGISRCLSRPARQPRGRRQHSTPSWNNVS